MGFCSPDRIALVLGLALIGVGPVLIGGCQVGTINGPGVVGSDGGGPAPETPEELFEATVEQLLSARCSSCHTDEATAPLFLGPGAYYDSVLAYPGLVIAGNPGISELLTKGGHDGPAWSPSEEATIEAWIEAEGESPPVDPPDAGSLQSMQITIDDGGVNQIPLDSIGLPGSSIEFNATSIASGMRLTGVALVGGTGGAAVSAPRFVMHTSDGMEIVDEDRFSGADLRANAGQRSELTTAMVLTTWPEGGTLSIRFASAMQME
ncbi:MAG: hypothetical protein AB8I08_10755 [Sandaracinaceae bacterium]